MADLVLKPSSGNLVLKDDQDVARATIATSTGATTLSGNVTLSNALPVASGGTGMTNFGGVIWSGYNSDNTVTTGTKTANTWYDASLDVTTATPHSSNSRYVIQGQFCIMDGNNNACVRVLRNAAENQTPATMIGAAVGSRVRATSCASYQGFDANQRVGPLPFIIYDDPNTTSAITYELQYMIEGTTAYINRNEAHADNALGYGSVVISTMMVFEFIS